MVLWYSQDEMQTAETKRVEKFFLDRETEYETGELVLPGWASVGNVASQFGDDESPFDG